jgi:hypothetical protein
MSIRILESDIFEPGTIELARALAFIGLHGTGKTLLLRMIEAAFGRTNQVDAPPFIEGSHTGIINGKLIRDFPTSAGGIIELGLRTPEGVITKRVDLSQSDAARRQIWTEVLGDSFTAASMSPLYLFGELTMLFQDYRNVPEMIINDEGEDAPSERLKALDNILGRPYDRVLVRSAFLAEAEDTGIFVPYISAFLGDRVFDSSMMSQGELWVHYMLNWFLEREVNRGDLALIDEPEAFLAARAQRPFIDQIARQVLEKDAQLIVSTHSPEILARFPLDNIRMCIGTEDGIRVIRPPSMVHIRESIGLETPVRMLVLVEDELAREILQELFARYDRALTREVEIVPAGGAGEVGNGLKVLKSVNRLACLGVLDGNERGKERSPAPSILFLPGPSFPEDELLAAARREAGWLADRMSVGLEVLFAAMSSCRGLDHQYWISTIAGHLGFAPSVVTYEFTQAWLRNEQIEEEAGVLVRRIRSEIIQRR